MLTVEQVREALDYDPETGVFRWKGRASRSDIVGALAGHMEARGYVTIRVCGSKHYAHRLAWLYVHGAWPSKFIDHINGDKSDNRIANLREATKAQNAGNQTRLRTNTSGFKGVCFHKQTGKFRANIVVDGRQLHLGLYPTAEEAHAAYLRAAKHHFGEFARAS